MDVDDEIDRLWQMLSNSSRRWALPRESPPCKCHSFERVSVSMRLFTDKGYSIESIECVGDETKMSMGHVTTEMHCRARTDSTVVITTTITPLQLK